MANVFFRAFPRGGPLTIGVLFTSLCCAQDSLPRPHEPHVSAYPVMGSHHDHSLNNQGGRAPHAADHHTNHPHQHREDNAIERMEPPQNHSGVHTHSGTHDYPDLREHPGTPEDHSAGHRHSDAHDLAPDVSVVIDTFYFNDDTPEGIEHYFEEVTGFGHSHPEHEHYHGGMEDGFNLRHVELRFAGEADPYFKGWATVAVFETGAEVEEAVIRTTCLPHGLQLQAGRMFSNFDYLNPEHSHEWDFVDLPLTHRLLFGTHGINETGLQVSRVFPTPIYLLAGAELFQGENEHMFHRVGGEHLPKREGPRLGIGWLKFGPNLAEGHRLRCALFCGHGLHEETHDGNGDGDMDHWLQGHGTFYGADFVYKYDAARPYGWGDFTFEIEYIQRDVSLEVMAHDLQPLLVGNDKVCVQDGYFLQAVYGFGPRWRSGVRWEQLGLTNRVRLPDGSRTNYPPSYRAAFMVDYSPGPASRLRFQFARGEYELADGRDGAWEFFVQAIVTLGSHGEHDH